MEEEKEQRENNGGCPPRNSAGEEALNQTPGFMWGKENAKKTLGSAHSGKINKKRGSTSQAVGPSVSATLTSREKEIKIGKVKPVHRKKIEKELPKESLTREGRGRIQRKNWKTLENGPVADSFQCTQQGAKEGGGSIVLRGERNERELGKRENVNEVQRQPLQGSFGKRNKRKTGGPGDQDSGGGPREGLKTGNILTYVQQKSSGTLFQMHVHIGKKGKIGE